MLLVDVKRIGLAIQKEVSVRTLETITHSSALPIIETWHPLPECALRGPNENPQNLSRELVKGHPMRTKRRTELPRKFLPMPIRNMWKASRRRNLAGAWVSKATECQGGEELQGTVFQQVEIHLAVVFTSSKWTPSAPASHSWQHGIAFLVPTFW